MLFNKFGARLRAGPPADRGRRRIKVAHDVLRGSGIEIGALHNPIPVSPSMMVTYVDRLPNEGLREHYPEIPSPSLVAVDIVDEAESLDSVPDASQDFVIANHILEHCQDPIRAISSWIRVIRYEGVVFLAVPNMKLTFDRHRHLTSWPHFVRDWEEGPAWSRNSHYLEWTELVEKHPPSGAPSHAARLMEDNYSIHFHVWTVPSLKRFLDKTSFLLANTFSLLQFVPNGDEALAILGKRRDA